MRVTRTSMLSGAVNSRELDVTQQQLDAAAGGVLIQDALPHLSPDDREFIKTGITPEEWQRVFPDDE